mgnify:FL=1
MNDLRPNTELVRPEVDQVLKRDVDVSKGTLTPREFLNAYVAKLKV